MEKPIHFTWKDKTFQFVANGRDCEACAFEYGSAACAESDRVQPCYRPEGVWQEVDPLVAAAQKAAEEAGPVVFANVAEMLASGPHPLQAGAVHFVESSSEKPTNPKDAIGIKKAPLSCVPMGVIAEMGVGMLEGASKYGRHNYRAVGVRASVYFDATMRHLIAWWEGEDVDPDSGINHISKALVSLAVLRDAQMQGMCTDDRPPRSAPFYADLNDKAAAVLDRHAGKNPRHYTIEDSK